MAKNLKLKIKNAQLAEALKLKTKKKETPPEKKEEAKEKDAAPKKKAVIVKKAQREEVKKPEQPKKPEPKAKEKAEEEKKPAKKEAAPPKAEPAAPKKEAAVSSPKTVKEKKEPAEKKTEEKPKETKKSKKKPETEEAPAEKKKAPVKEFRDLKPGKKMESRSFDSRDRRGLGDLEESAWRRRRYKQKASAKTEQVIIRPKALKVKIPITIKDLASAMKLKASELISKLFMQGIALTLNDYLDDETTIQLLGHEFECEITVDTSEEERLRITDKSISEEIQETDQQSLLPRPPIIAFMGHVDHGKTSLIDAIRKSNITEEEAGAITQHIGAFSVHVDSGNITILDTPGHEAFTAMRERGATVTDIIVLVVAGDEGIKPQTDEAIEKARAANVPIVVAINKSDKPAFNEENVYRQLAERNLLPEAWGGDIITVNCSAATREGLKELLEMILLQAEILELRANPNTRGRGSVLESELHKGFGSTATLLVQNGTLKIGDALVFEHTYGRVKSMHDEHNKPIDSAPPSTPVRVTGLSGLPDAGCEFIVVSSEKDARKLCEEREAGHKQQQLMQMRKKSLESLMERKAELSEKKVLNLILKADVQGSLEAIKTSLRKIPTDKVEINLVSDDVGQISESDIQLAHASNAVIIGFHTGVESHAENLLKQTKVTVETFDVIYHLIDEVKKIMTSLLDKIKEEKESGTAFVKATFKSSQLGIIAGCEVKEGVIRRSQQAKVFRNDEKIWEGDIVSLKRVKEDVKEVSKGLECGILLSNFSEVQEGDIIKSYDVVYHPQEL
ncbi:MAG: hypothetical protein Tsb0015_09970 [Simkaniaceae bacterium]